MKSRSRWWGVALAGAGFGVILTLVVVGTAYTDHYGGILIDGSSANGLLIRNYSWTGLYIEQSDGSDYIRAGGDDLDFRVTADGYAYADGGWRGSADFAELMVVEGDLERIGPGDVMVICASLDRTVELSQDAQSQRVIGVYSTKPGFIGSSHAMEERKENEIPVAVMGIVPCNVSAENGSIRRGDLLVTASIPGHAMKATDAQVGCILGKALGELGSGTGVIEVLLTLQ